MNTSTMIPCRRAPYRESGIPSQIQNAKTLKINSTLKMKTRIKRTSTFWHRFVAIMKNKTVVPETLKIERGMNRMKFDSFENNIQRK